MISSLLASLFIAHAFAQEANPLESEFELEPSTPPAVTKPVAPAPNTLKRKMVKRKAVATPPPAKKLPYAFLPAPFMKLRFAEANRDFGIFTADLGVNAPGQFYFYSRTNIRSTSASESRTDFLTYNSQNYLISPQIYGFGAAVNWVNSSTAKSAATRGGLYFRILEKFGSTTMMLVFAHTIADFQDESSRALVLYNFTFFDNFIGLNGNISSAKLRSIWSAGFDGDISFRIYEGLRLSLGYALSRRVGAPDADYAFAGLELRSQF